MATGRSDFSQQSVDRIEIENARQGERHVSFSGDDTPPPRPPLPRARSNVHDEQRDRQYTPVEKVQETPELFRRRPEHEPFERSEFEFVRNSTEIGQNGLSSYDCLEDRSTRMNNYDYESAYRFPSYNQARTPRYDQDSDDFHALPRIAHSPIRREKEQEKFDGKSVDWKDYIVHFEQAARWNHWTEREKAQQLSMSLRGAAQKLLGDLSEQDVNDYYALKTILSQRFNPRERVTAYRCEFRARKRKTSEGLPDFGYALRRLVRLAYPDGEYGVVLEQLVINQFILGLSHAEMERHVQFAHPQTLEAAIAYAVEFEAFTNAQTAPRKPRDEGFPLNIGAINKENTPVKELNSDKIREHGQNNEMKEMIKSFSDCVGKMSEALDKISKPQRENSRPFNRQDRNPIVCWTCSKKGHVARFCRSSQCQNTNTLNSERPKDQEKN